MAPVTTTSVSAAQDTNQEVCGKEEDAEIWLALKGVLRHSASKVPARDRLWQVPPPIQVSSTAWA